MPLKVSVGLSKKIGLPDYGSLGASCHVEFELDGGLLDQDVAGFQRRVRGAYAACRQAVQEELARQPSGPSNHGSEANGRGQRNINGASHRATTKQLDFLRQLALQLEGLGIRRLENLVQSRFHKPLAELSSSDASTLIDTLRSVMGGQVRLDEVLDGVTT